MARHQLVIISLLCLQASAVIRVPLRREVLSVELGTGLLEELEVEEEAVAGVSDMAMQGEMHADNPPKSPFNTAILQQYGDLYGLITIGTPPQMFKVKLSTALSGLHIPSAKCTHSGHPCRTFRNYDSSKSSTYMKNGTEISVQLGNVTVKTIVSQDTVRLAGVVVPDQQFAEVVDDPSVIPSNTDGVLGLGYPSLSFKGLQPVFDRIMQLKLLPLNIISYYFNSNLDIGELMLGGTNPNLCKGKLHYVPVVGKPNWQIAVNGVALGKDLTLCANGCKAALHTSAKGISGPAVDIDAIHKAIGAKPIDKHGLGAVPCDTIPLLPKLTFKLGGKEFVLSPLDYIIWNPKQKRDLCMTRFLPRRHSLLGQDWVLGQAFLHNFYTVFDRDQDRVGFGPIKAQA